MKMTTQQTTTNETNDNQNMGTLPQTQHQQERRVVKVTPENSDMSDDESNDSDDEFLDKLFKLQDMRAKIYVKKLIYSESAVTREVGQMLQLLKEKINAPYIVDQVINGDWGVQVFLIMIGQQEANTNLIGQTLDLVKQDGSVLKYKIFKFDLDQKIQRADPPDVKIFRIYNLNPIVNDSNLQKFFKKQGSIVHAHMEYTKIGAGDTEKIMTNRCLIKFKGEPKFVIHKRIKAMFQIRKFKKMKYVYVNAPQSWKDEIKAYPGIQR